MYTLNINNGITFSAASIIGKREQQQDYYTCSRLSDRTIAIVCDGMGGLAGGSIASRYAANLLLKDLENVNPSGDMHTFFKYELEKLDDAIYGLKDESGARLGAGTTIVAVLLFGNKLYWFSVGDSKLYYMRNQEMYCVTRSHNYAMQLEEMKKNSLIDEQKYKEESQKGEQLISYLGMGMAEIFDGNYSPFTMEVGDKILLCTDGVYRTLNQQEIRNIMESRGNTEYKCKKFEETILEKQSNTQDNATWIVIQKIGE